MIGASVESFGRGIEMLQKVAAQIKLSSEPIGDETAMEQWALLDAPVSKEQSREWAVGDSCEAELSDGHFYIATVSALPSNGFVEVCFPEYGENTIMHLSQLRSVKEMVKEVTKGVEGDDDEEDIEVIQGVKIVGNALTKSVAVDVVRTDVEV